MRVIVLCLFFAPPAAAWEFSPTPICTLTGPQTVVTYDAALPEYTITVEHPDGWGAGGVFAIRYDGVQPLTISTDRHMIAADMLTVADRGFGNVLGGMAVNDSFTAMLGDRMITVSLAGIGPALTAFRACPAPATS